MKNKQFYHHLINHKNLVILLEEVNVSGKEKEHLLNLFYGSVHAAVLDKVLSELHEKDKTLFLEHLYHNNNEKTWEFLNIRNLNMEKKVEKVIHELEKAFEEDIKTL